MKSNGKFLFANIPPTLAAAMITIVGLWYSNHSFTSSIFSKLSSFLEGEKIAPPFVISPYPSRINFLFITIT